MEYNQKDVPMPRAGKTPLELLDAKDDEPLSIFNVYGARICGGLIASTFQAGKNWANRRPIFAGKLSIETILYSTSVERFNQTGIYFDSCRYSYVWYLVCYRSDCSTLS